MSTPIDDLLRDDILEWLGRDESLARELAAMVLPELDRHLERLRDAVRAQDGEALRQAAHRLKSAIGVFGELRAWTLTQAIENAGRAGRLSDAPQLVQELEEALRALRATLGTF